MSFKSYFPAHVYFILLLCVFTGSRFVGIDSQSFWVDEINLARIAREIIFLGNPVEFIQGIFAIVKIEPHPPLYFLICKIWVSIFGSNPLILRTLSVVWAVALFILLGTWSRKNYGARFSHLLLLLLIFSPTILDEAVHFRPYTFVMLLGAAITVAYLNFLKNENQLSWLFAVCALFTIAALTHYVAVIFALAVAGHQFLYGVIKQPKNYIKWFLNSTIIMLACVPAIIWYGATFEELHARHLDDLTRTRGIKDYISPFWALLNYPGLLILIIAPLAGWAGGFTKNIKAISAKLTSDPQFIACFGISALFFVLIAAGAVFQPSLLQNKNILFAFPMLFIVFVKFIMVFAEDSRVFRLTVVAGLIGFIFFFIAGQSREFAYLKPWREQVREGADVILISTKPGDIVLFGTVAMNKYWLQPTKYYMSLIGKQGLLPEGLEVLIFPPGKIYELEQIDAVKNSRLTMLTDSLAKIQRSPGKRLFLDLPHYEYLSPAENELLIKSGLCVMVSEFIQQRIVVVENKTDMSSCVPWDSNLTIPKYD